MEMRQVRYFIAVAEEENFTTAARRLNVSQPPITRQIQQLEAELGVELFSRGKKGVKITSAGQAFLREAKQIVNRSRLAVERSRAAARGEIGTLEMAYFGSPIFSILPRLMRRFRDENASVSISLHPLMKKEQVEAVKDGRIQIGFGRYYPFDPDLSIEQVADEPVMLAMAASHRFAGRDTLSLKDVQKEPFIIFPRSGRPSFADETLRAFHEGGVDPRIEFEAEDLSSALALCAAGLGLCVAPTSVAGLSWPGIRFAELPQLNVQCPVSCIYLADNQSPILSRFLRMIRSVDLV
ncbi:MAG: LysR family transcriptional regulator [Pseudomonadota bacterium]